MGIILIEDTRNKIDKHRNVHEYCERHSVDIVRLKLDVGDYAFPGGRVSVDTKQNLEELARNLMNRSDSSRFWREIRRAYQSKIKLIILCEHGGPIKSLQDVAKWKSKYGTASGRWMLNEMLRTERAYGVRWVFCQKKSTGKRIIELLSEEGQNWQAINGQKQRSST